MHAQVPGNIRRAEHFCQFLRRLVEYMKERISAQVVEQESCTTFLANLQERMAIDGAGHPVISAPIWPVPAERGARNVAAQRACPPLSTLCPGRQPCTYPPGLPFFSMESR